MEELIPLSIIAILIAIAPTISQHTKMPIVVIEMLMGAIGAYFGIIYNTDSLNAIAEVGFLFLMFLCGLEVDLKTFKDIKKPLLKRIALYFLSLYSMTIFIVLYFGLSPIYIAALPIIGVGMIMTLVKEYGKDKIWLDLVLRVGVMGELISIVVLVILNGVYSFGFSIELSKMLFVLIGFLLAVVGIFQGAKLIFWWFPKVKLFLLPKDDANNQDIRFSAMLFFVFVGIVILLKLEIVLGAFIAGSIIATFFKYKHELPHKLNSFGFGFFVPLFFIHVGSTLDISTIFSQNAILLKAILIVIAMVSIRFISAFISYKNYFKDTKNILLYALSDSMPLTFLVATATLGLSLNAIDQNTYYAFVLAAIIEGLLFSSAIKLIVNLWTK